MGEQHILVPTFIIGRAQNDHKRLTANVIETLTMEQGKVVATSRTFFVIPPKKQKENTNCVGHTALLSEEQVDFGCSISHQLTFSSRRCRTLSGKMPSQH